MAKVPFVTKEQLDEIVKKYPTPFHLYDEKGIRENIKAVKEARRVECQAVCCNGCLRGAGKAVRRQEGGSVARSEIQLVPVIERACGEVGDALVIDVSPYIGPGRWRRHNSQGRTQQRRKHGASGPICHSVRAAFRARRGVHLRYRSLPRWQMFPLARAVPLLRPCPSAGPYGCWFAASPTCRAALAADAGCRD